MKHLLFLEKAGLLSSISGNYLQTKFILTNYTMRLFVVFFCLLFISSGAIAQSKHKHDADNNPSQKLNSDGLKSKSDTNIDANSVGNKLIMIADTLTPSDYMMSIQRVNDNIIEIRDSVKLDFDITEISKRVDIIAKDILIIRQNIKDKRAVIRIKTLYLYQNFASNLDNEVDSYQTQNSKMFNTVFVAKQRLKRVLNDSVFHKLYADSSLRKTYDKKLIRLEKKWVKTDSTAKANIDSLNVLKLKIADNSISLTNMLKIMDTKLDKAAQQLFGQETNSLWEKTAVIPNINDSANSVRNIFLNEGKVIGYYFDQTTQQRWVVLFIGFLIFFWLFMKRKLFKMLRNEKDSFAFLALQYLNHSPVLSLLALLFCLMPFFDAYAPTAYLTIEYLIILCISSIIFFKKKEAYRFDWIILAALFLATTLTFILITPTLPARIWLLILHTGILVFSFRFLKRLDKQMPFYKLISPAVVIAIILVVAGVIFNLFGRFSLSNILGVAGVFAIIQAVILPIFIQAIIEIILLQLQGSRLNRGVDKPFDCAIVIKKIKGPLVILAILLWVIMLASNLNIYHNLTNRLVETMTLERSLGSITFKLVNLMFFFAIIWFAHILQQLISFLFGETGTETDDISPISKGQHSRLLITRLLVLVGGYLLAIAASGLPIDKLTFLLGALGIGIGMGLQNMVNNFVSGIILIFDGSLKIGDEIEIGGQSGKVKEIGLRSSTINTDDGAEVIIPNGNILSQNIINWTLSNDEKRVMIQFSISGKDLDANIINEIINHTIKSIPHVISKRKPVILYTRVKQETYSLNVHFWCIINKAYVVKSDAILHLHTAFTQKNIGFVFNSFTEGELHVNVTES